MELAVPNFLARGRKLCYYRSIVMLSKEELAHHIIDNEGMCRMPGRCCTPKACPIEAVCMRIHKLEWAMQQVHGDTNEGQCNSIW